MNTYNNYLEEVTLSEFFFAVVAKDLSPRVRVTTWAGYEKAYNSRIAPILGYQRLADISPLDIRSWQSGLISQGYSESYQIQLNSLLSRTFDLAVRFYDLPENPCVLAGRIGRTGQSQRADIWTLNEFWKVYDHIPDPSIRTQVAFIFWTGLRKGELYGLKWEDFDRSRGEIRIVRSYQRHDGRGLLLPPKTARGKRIISLPLHQCEALEMHYRNQNCPSPNEHIFKWTKRKLEDGIAEACARSGVKRIRVHDIRHSHASLLIRMNADIAAISQRLGHSSITMTLNVYAHTYDRADRTIANQLDSVADRSDADLSDYYS